MPHDSTSSRARILRLLRRHGPLDAAQLAGRLKMTSVGVRLHVNQLREKGLIASRAERQARGRPHHLYSLTPEADRYFPKGYEELVGDLLGCLERVAGPAEVTKVLGERRKGLVQKYRPRVKGALARRVAALTEIQSEREFMPEAKRTDGGFVMREWNCPFAAAAAATGAVCESERRMFEALLGVKVRLGGTRAKGAECCTFRIGAAAKASA